jgi:thioredoxin reductase (NADPH)
VTDPDGTSGSNDAGPPVLLIVDGDERGRRRTVAALRHRFSPDFRVVGTDTPEAGIAMLSRLEVAEEDVALVAADLHLSGVDRVGFLERAHDLCPGASRVLLVAMDRHHTRISFSELHTLQRATALGRIDSIANKGWTTPEEWLYLQAQEALTRWTKAHRPGHIFFQIATGWWCMALEKQNAVTGAPTLKGELRCPKRKWSRASPWRYAGWGCRRR